MDTLLNSNEAAAFLGISEESLNKLVGSKLIPAYTIGGQFLRFKKEELGALRDMLKEGEGLENERIFHQAFSEVRGFARFRELLAANDIYLLAFLVIALILGFMFFR